MQISSNFKKRIPYLLATIILVYISKPSFFFKPNGKIRNYGIGYDDDGYKKSLYTFQHMIIILILLLIIFI